MGLLKLQGLTISDKSLVHLKRWCCEDEVNLIEKNHGWPVIEGMHNKPERVASPMQIKLRI
jgi:hypothetical protein